MCRAKEHRRISRTGGHQCRCRGEVAAWFRGAHQGGHRRCPRFLVRLPCCCPCSRRASALRRTAPFRRWWSGSCRRRGRERCAGCLSVRVLRASGITVALIASSLGRGGLSMSSGCGSATSSSSGCLTRGADRARDRRHAAAPSRTHDPWRALASRRDRQQRPQDERMGQQLGRRRDRRACRVPRPAICLPVCFALWRPRRKDVAKGKPDPERPSKSRLHARSST